MDDPLTEPQIVRGLRQGDSNAWTALCHQYSARLWRYIARLIGSDEAAVADVFQETMLAVARAGRNLSSDTQLWAWLATIGHHRAARYWRNRYQTQSVLIVDNLEDEGCSPEAALSRQETVGAVRVLLSEMTADHAAVLTAKYIDGLSVAEMTKILGGTLESVRSRLARARREFRQRYEAQNNDATEQSLQHRSPL